VAAELRGRRDIDLVHDHVEAAGLTVLGAMGAGTPPVLHTLHWDLGKHPELYSALDGGGRMWVNGVSAAQLARAPAALRAHSVGHVHLGTPLAVGAGRRTGLDVHSGFGIGAGRVDYHLVLGRVTPGKGQHIAARLAHATGMNFVLAGPVGPHHTTERLANSLTDPDAARNPDVRYWCDHVAPYVDGHRVRWIGSVFGTAKEMLLARARATVFPLEWEEPGGTAVVESLALGTPVVGYRRGCLGELVDHGRTGLLVEPGDEDGLIAALRVVAMIRPAECRREAARRFTPGVMADEYLRLYDTVLDRARAARSPVAATPAAV
jgi:glycosyltransferase involved in cell wall biosynthesis